MAVRREKVLLEVESELAPTMLRDAAAVALLKRELKSLSGQAVTTSRSTQNLERDNDRVARSATKAESTINQLTGRLRLMADVAAILGPALIPIGAVGVPALAGLANELGVAALAGGTAIVAFQGIGTALKAVNTAALEPTTANLEAARLAMERLSPAARDMVRELQSLRTVGDAIRDAGAEGLFPGVIDALDALESRAPDVERIVGSLGRVMGDLTRDAGVSLASNDWDEFFHFLATDAAATLESMGRATGDLAHGLAQLWMDLDPLSDGFSSWIEDVATGFDTWATGLDQTKGFREFLDYVHTNGPQVADTVGALADAVLQIVEASAPLGGPVLHGLEAVARAVAAIADSNLGTPIMTAVTAMALLSRGTKVYEGLAATTWGAKSKANIIGMSSAMRAMTTEQQRATMSSAELQAAWDKRTASVRAGAATIGKGVAVLGALTLATTGAADSVGLANTATGALIGTVGGPLGIALGTAIGFLADAKRATDEARRSTEDFNRVLDTGSPDDERAKLAELRAELESIQHIQPWDVGKWLNAGGVGAPRVEELRGQIDALQRALDTKETGEGISRLLGDSLPRELGLLPPAFDAATQSAQEFRESLAKVSAALDGRANLRDFKAAIDDYRHSLDDAIKSGKDFLNQNKDGFRTSTNLGREMEAALDAIANSSLAAAENMKGMARTRFLDNARDQFINAARAAHLTKGAAEDLADELGLVDRIKAKPEVDPQGIPETHHDLDGVGHAFDVIDRLTGGPTINVSTARALHDMYVLQQALHQIPDETVFVNVRRLGGPQGGPMASGGTVPGARYPYGDKYFAHLAPGEEVVSNRHGQADRWRPLLKAINANRMADGGTAMTRAARSPQVNVSTSTGPLTATAVLTDDQFARLEVAIERGAARGASTAGTAASQALSEARWT